MRRQQQERLSSEPAQAMLDFRRKLPSFAARNDFLSALQKHQVNAECAYDLLHAARAAPID